MFIVFPDDIPEYIPKKPEHVIKIKVGRMGNSFRVGNSSIFSECARLYGNASLYTMNATKTKKKAILNSVVYGGFLIDKEQLGR